MARRITLDERAFRQLKKLQKNIGRKVFKAIEGLESNPTPPGSTKLETTDHLRKLRVGNHRVVYALDADEIFIMKVADRKDVYGGLKALEKRLLQLHLKK